VADEKMGVLQRAEERTEVPRFKDEILQRRSIVLEHPDDVQGHRCPIFGDSLPMRLTLGSVCDTFRFFTCTTQWEIRRIWYQSVFLGTATK
jgi:hypothetical protein